MLIMLLLLMRRWEISRCCLCDAYNANAANATATNATAANATATNATAANAMRDMLMLVLLIRR